MQLELHDQSSEVEIRDRRPALRCTVDGAHYTVREAADGAAGSLMLTVNGVTHRVWRVREGNRVHLKIGGRYFSVAYEDAVRAAADDGAAGHEIRADMPGVVVAVQAHAGTTVEAGDALLVIESMKMQVTVAAPRAGVVDAVHVAPNESFQKGAMLVALQP